MKRAVLVLVACESLSISAQQVPRLTLDYPAIATRLVAQLALKPGERVLSLAHPGMFEDLLPSIRYEVMKAGGIDLGVVSVLREPWPESFDPQVVIRGARESRAHYKDMFRNVDAAIMMPGATTAHPAYLAIQDWLKDDLTENAGGVRSIFTGSKTAVRMKCRVNRCRLASRSTRSINGRCSKPTTRRWQRNSAPLPTSSVAAPFT